VLAATNHVEILDEALAGRFDEVIEYGLPDRTAAREILERSFASSVLGASRLAMRVLHAKFPDAGDLAA
jgi:AAA+ superfamily predicted ATPase